MKLQEFVKLKIEEAKELHKVDEYDTIKFFKKGIYPKDIAKELTDLGYILILSDCSEVTDDVFDWYNIDEGTLLYRWNIRNRVNEFLWLTNNE